MSRLLQAVAVPWVALHRHVTPDMKLRLFGEFGYDPNPPQLEFHSSRARFRVLCWGRRTGKTTANVMEDLVYAMLGGKVWSVAPTFDLTGIAFAEAMQVLASRRAVRELVHGDPNMAKGSQTIRFKTGGVVAFKSSFNPNSLVGSGLDHISGDEWALENDSQVWTQALRPTLIDRIGSASFGSTPRGDNQFKDLFEKGQNPDLARWESWQRSTRDNPRVSEAEIQELILEEDMSESDIAQEIEALFMDIMGAVFRGYADCMVLDDLGEETGVDETYVLGGDLAKYEDWTVLVVMGSVSGRVVAVERFNSTSWVEQVEQIAQLAEKWRAPVVLDATGVGDPIVDALTMRMGGWPVEGFVFTNKTKTLVMRQLARAIQYKELKLPSKKVPIGRIMGQELGAYQYSKTKAGNITMGAPPGKHDDAVTALALCYEAALRFGGRLSSVRVTGVEEEAPPPKMRGEFGPDDSMAVGKRKVPKMRRR